MPEREEEELTITDLLENSQLEEEKGYIMLGDWYLTEYPSLRVPRNVTLKIDNAHIFTQKEFQDLKKLNYSFTFKFL